MESNITNNLWAAPKLDTYCKLDRSLIMFVYKEMDFCTKLNSMANSYFD